MSSIIKTGCAPSNTPDGKYFLQTDQACYAELKRGRTYIMTAQEEAKVSHYVIITNADFTVTFNGDSDLVQVGLANNAIVMNVQRACRIDFTQGGNLEFKEGTADLSSRITMGPNANGNVLVASSLPQQGDVAGQICSLTTGATYVWTGSQWSSTAGSSTLPTPTSANKFFGLVCDGSSWVANKGVYAKYLASSSSVQDSYAFYPLIVWRGLTSAMHYACDIQFGQHNSLSTKAHIEITGGGAGGTLASLSAIITIAQAPSVTELSTTTMANLDPKIYYDATSNIVYLSSRLNTSRGGILRATVYDQVLSDDWLEITSTEILHAADRSAYTLMPTTVLTSVPVSTAANQMLVSDGNGGWEVLAAGAVGTTLKMTSDGPAWST